jgi:hypothetical protein
LTSVAQVGPAALGMMKRGGHRVVRIDQNQRRRRSGGVEQRTMRKGRAPRNCPSGLPDPRAKKARWLADDGQESLKGELHRERPEMQSVRIYSLLQALYNPQVIALAVTYCSDPFRYRRHQRGLDDVPGADRQGARSVEPNERLHLGDPRRPRHSRRDRVGVTRLSDGRASRDLLTRLRSTSLEER